MAPHVGPGHSSQPSTLFTGQQTVLSLMLNVTTAASLGHLERHQAEACAVYSMRVTPRCDSLVGEVTEVSATGLPLVSSIDHSSH